MASYYTNSILELKRLLKENKNLTQKEWNQYKTGKPLWGSQSIMWVYAETTDWDIFIEKIKEEM